MLRATALVIRYESTYSSCDQIWLYSSANPALGSLHTLPGPDAACPGPVSPVAGRGTAHEEERVVVALEVVRVRARGRVLGAEEEAAVAARGDLGCGGEKGKCSTQPDLYTWVHTG